MTTGNHSSPRSYDASRRPPRRVRVVLTVGFLALTAGLVAALGSPAGGYELSIYRSTPLAFWAGAAIALLAATLIAFHPGPLGHLRTTALALAASTALSVLALPMIRGYYFYGQGDSLSHLGFARSFAEGTMSPMELLHPGVHLASVVIESATGIELRSAMLLAVLVFFALFFLFVPLCVRRVANTDGALVVGLFAALLLLPINAVGTHVVTHPSSQAIMFTPFVLYLLFTYLYQPNGGRLHPSRIGALLILVSPAILLIHPQEAMNILILFFTIASIQFVFRRFRPTHPFATQRSVLFQALFLGALWLLWAPRSSRVTNRLDAAYAFLFGGGGSSTAAEVSGRSVALSVIGGSIEELFVKLFLDAVVFSVIAGIVMLATVFGRLDGVFPDRNALNKYLTIGFVPLFVGTMFVAVGSFGDHYFRFIGFLMVFVTILAAAAIARASEFTARISTRTLRSVTVVLFLLLLPLGFMALHPSPWIYQDTSQVTEQEVEGYETAFEQSAAGIGYAGIRGGGDRYVEAIYGPRSAQASEFPGEAIPPEVFGTNLTTYYDDPRYVPIRRSDVEREVELYNGLRYEADGFRRLETTPDVHRVQSTDEFRLYLITDD